MTTDRPRLTHFSHGAGCACKLSSDDLRTVLGLVDGLAADGADADLLVGFDTADDAAVYRLRDDLAIVFTTDFFTPIVDDPYDWGRVAAANALSDVYAMGGSPLLALNLVAWPRDALPLDLLARVLDGGAAVARSAGCVVAGGHSIDDPEPKYGMAVIGTVHPDRLLTNAGAMAGDALVLTKPIGVGAIVTALKRDLATAAQVSKAVATMTTLNEPARDRALDSGAHAATDVTGFGLLGHLREMAAASAVHAEIDLSSVPVLEGRARPHRGGCGLRRNPPQPGVGRSERRVRRGARAGAPPTVRRPDLRRAPPGRAGRRGPRSRRRAQSLGGPGRGRHRALHRRSGGHHRDPLTRPARGPPAQVGATTDRRAGALACPHLLDSPDPG